jgi:hypothetical protein
VQVLTALASSSMVGLTDALAGGGASAMGVPSSAFNFSISFYSGVNISGSVGSGSLGAGIDLLALSRFLNSLSGSQAAFASPDEMGQSPLSIHSAIVYIHFLLEAEYFSILLTKTSCFNPSHSSASLIF